MGIVDDMKFLKGIRKKMTKPKRTVTKAREKKIIGTIKGQLTKSRNKNSQLANGIVSNVKARTFTSAITQVQKGQSPFPSRYAVKLPWTVITGLACPATETIGRTRYRLNSAYDPVYSAGGSQPNYFDAMKVLYRSYRPSGALVTIRWNDPSADGYYGGYRLRNESDTDSTGLTHEQFIT